MAPLPNAHHELAGLVRELGERLENSRREVANLAARFDALSDQFVQKREDVAVLKHRIDEFAERERVSASRKWDWWKLVLATLVGSIGTVVVKSIWK